MVEPMSLAGSIVESRQLLSKGERFDEDDSSHLCLVWMENSQIYLTEMNRSGLDFDESTLGDLEGKHIPEEDVYPPWRGGITEAPVLALPADSYIKMPYSHCLHGRVDFELINAEIDILEELAKKPHPNIVEYLGCIREGDRIKGICLRKYACTLWEIVEDKVLSGQLPPFDADMVISDIKAGLDFLHSLGLVHDDINPRNIMLNDDGHAVIIDFDACKAVGTESRGGTPGWSKNPAMAQFENDDHGLELVIRFIRREYDGQDCEPFGF